jgi:ribosomal protein L21E
MLRASILHFDKSWDKCLSLAEFSYNNSYQASLEMALFDALYRHKCRTPLNWSEAGERTLFGPDLVKDAKERVQVIRENLEMAQMRQKSYHDKGTAPRHFEVGDYVYLKVSPTKGVQRFRLKGKLAPRYIGPYEVIEVCGPMAYRIQIEEGNACARE